jgi:hypothetical protein
VIGFRKLKTKDGVKDLVLDDVEKYPLVQFVNGKTRVIGPQKFESRVVGLGTCTRIAVPLRLAWAITTHKSQGMTLDYVVADVGGVFADGQTYVALSRASDERGLELRGFSPSRVRANPIALQFYSSPNKSLPCWDGSTTEPSADPITSVQKINRREPSPAPPRPAFASTLDINEPSDDPVPSTEKAKKKEPSPPLDPSSLEKYKVPELKEMLRARGLKVSGKKAELIERLCSDAPL